MRWQWPLAKEQDESLRNNWSGCPRSKAGVTGSFENLFLELLWIIKSLCLETLSLLYRKQTPAAITNYQVQAQQKAPEDLGKAKSEEL